METRLRRVAAKPLRLMVRIRPRKTAFRIEVWGEMVCPLICKQMGKRDDGYGFIRS